MDRNKFPNEIALLRKRLSKLQRLASRSKSSKAAGETATELKNALAELSSLQEHLIDQNTELATARQRAEEEKDRYRNLFHLAPDGYLVTDRRSVILEANHAAARLLDVPSESLIGKPLAFYAARENLKKFLTEAVGAAHRGGMCQFETRLRNHKKIIDVLVAVGATSNGASLRWLIRDITENKQIEERMRSSERVSTMGTTALLLANEISNPLNDMFTTVQRMQRDSDDSPAIRSAVQELMGETTRLRGLLEKFLSFSRTMNVHPVPSDLCVLLEEILNALTQLYGHRDIAIEKILPPSLLIQADHERLKQAFLNICLNAVEAMPQGGRLTVHASVFDGRAVAEIMDTGEGVPKGIDVFDLFTTTKFQAMGMGLPIARQIILDHGGTISYSSQPGNTSFRVDLPTAQP